MKKALPFLMSMLCLKAFSQETPRFLLSKEINCVGETGRPYRFEIAVKSDISDLLSKMNISVKVENDISTRRLDYKSETRKEQEWTVLTIIGVIPEKVSSLNFEFAILKRGTFYFDDINFYIKERTGQWKQAEIPNPSFEEEAGALNGYNIQELSGRQSYETSTAIYKVGKRSLVVDLNEPKPAIKYDVLK
jgi:hypothetical protein